MNSLMIKVCGMRDPKNIKDIKALLPDFMGFIMVKSSPRYIGESNKAIAEIQLPLETSKTGVFVNEKIEEIIAAVEFYEFDAIQLHGDETVDYCRLLKDELYASNLEAVEIIKAFQVKEGFDFNYLNAYIPFTSYFLFDTATENYGGSGISFNWKILEKYTCKHPFFLSGGIQPVDVPAIKNIHHEQLVGVDINSKFEISPALKNTSLVSKFINELRK